MLLVAVAAVTILGTSGLSAQKAAPTQERPDQIAELTEQLADRDAKIAALTEQLGVARQAAIRTEDRIDIQQDTILEFQEIKRRNDDVEVDAFEQWRVGYAIGGGQNLRAFERVILPCESGGEDDPDAAIGPTDDWGRAQINRPTWSDRFEELTGASFEELVRQPLLNGYMAARVEVEHSSGLNAWTCWRRRR